jgi:orotidine-5'-phosphate decarboxylase
MGLSPRERLIVALDVAEVEEARALTRLLGDRVSFYKIGLELTFNGGIELARALKAEGKAVFLDMKLHDIPNQVERAVANIARIGVDLLTVHAYPQTLAAAAAGRGRAPLKLLGVTVLTSMAQEDAQRAGYSSRIEELVAIRAGEIRAAGVDGVVCSPLEAGTVRALVGPDALIVVPGIRPTGAAVGDQARTATPAEAIRAGASHLVVGRPITRAGDPRAAAEAVLAEIAAA